MMLTTRMAVAPTKVFDVCFVYIIETETRPWPDDQGLVER